ncbi:MAG: chorismate mutase [Patescibacteria group bacterium]|jgi:chorismate mutase
MKIALTDKQVSAETQNELDKLRQGINKIDEQIVKNIAERFNIVQQIKQYKQQHSLSVQDVNREEQLLLRVAALAQQYQLPVEFVAHLFDVIMQQSRQQQKQ